MTKTLLYSAFALGLVLTPAAARAQAAPEGTPAQAPAQTAPSFDVLGEDYHVELQVGAWFTVPSTVLYSDTESITSTVNGTSTTTVVSGTNVDFKSLLGLTNKVFPEAHLTIRLRPKHKLRGEFIPAYYGQTVGAVASDFTFNGQTYKAGETVQSTLHWTVWDLGYEFDPIVSDRGYIGAIVAVSSLNVSGATANAAQSGTASVNIIMPGLGATARYYASSKLSVTGEFLAFDLPGSATSTHGHIVEASGYATYNLNKHIGAQAGYRFTDTAHTWGDPLNTGTMTIGGPFVGGTAHF
jgi:hypothetical protein